MAANKAYLFVAALVLAAINILPLLLITPSGDVVMNYAQIQCYSEQIWSGIFYPRWCMSPNSGMGSPGPIFYFPLGYYVAALFAPLKLTVEHQYIAGVYAASVVAFLTTVAWLRKIVSLRVACFAAFVLLLGYYRSELIARGSYAEYWCVALLPLLFMYVREACEGGRRVWPKLTLVLVLCLFAHAAATVIGLMACGLFIFIYGRGNIMALAQLAVSCVLAAMISLFQYLPTRTLIDTLNDELGGRTHWKRSWVNSFVDRPVVYIDHQWAVIGASIGVLTTIFICGALWRRRRQLPLSKRREGVAWGIIAIFALFMMFSVSKPIWWGVELVSSVATPWRMQMLFVFAFVVCIAIMAQYLWYQKKKTRSGDMLLSTLYFALTSMFYVGGVAEESMEHYKKQAPEQFILIYFGTKDTDKQFKDVGLFFERFVDREGRKKAEWVRGSGDVRVEQWDAGGIIISGRADGASVLRLEHFNYPIWQAERNDIPTRIVSEPETGRMLLSVPEGEFTFKITQHYRDIMPQYYSYILLLSALGLVIIAGGAMWPKRDDETSIVT